MSTNPMPTEESNEARLLRLLIGYFHISLLNQLALQRHATSLEKLDPQAREALANDMLAAVAAISKQATPETVKEILSAIPPNVPTIFH